MGLLPGDLEKVPPLTHDIIYNRIKIYYCDFMKTWDLLSEAEKINFRFGNGFTCDIDYINNSSSYLSQLKSDPTLEDSIYLAKNVIREKLEYLYHNEDRHGIKMGAYAHFIINNYNKGRL